MPSFGHTLEGGAWQGGWVAGLGGDTLLEDLVCTAGRHPERLEPMRPSSVIQV